MDNKSDNNVQYISTSNETIEKERKESYKNFFLTTGTFAVSEYIKSNFIDELIYDNTVITNFFNKTLAGQSFKYTTGVDWKYIIDKMRLSNIVMFDTVRRLEEGTPLRIGRTFQLSHLLMPIITGDKLTLDISAETVSKHTKYFSALLHSKGEKQLSDMNIKFGFRFQNGALYEKTSPMETGDVVLKHARLILDKYSLPSSERNKSSLYVNRILKQYHTLIGGGIDDKFGNRLVFETPDFFVIGGKSKTQMYFDLARSYGRVVMEKGTKVWDNLIGTIVDLIPHAEDSKIHKKISNFLNINLGTGGKYRQSVMRSMIDMIANQKKMIGAVVGYKILDAMVTGLAPEDSAWSKGIYAGLMTMGVNADVMYSELVSDHLQGYKEAQERIAPGSTSFTSIIGVPLALGMASATASYFKRLQELGSKGIVDSTVLAEQEAEILPKFLRNMLPEKMSEFKGTRWQRWGARGALLGLLLEAPFIPGALIGESSEEKKAIYSGKKDIPIKTNRWWSTSSVPYEGEKTKYFEKHPYYKTMQEAEVKSLYGDLKTKHKLDPFLHPFDYLRDPYRFEKMHQEDRPYPVYGMDISTGSFLGKLYEKTIGAIIKPDVINKEKLKEVITPIEGKSNEEALKEYIKKQIFDIKEPIGEDEASLIAEKKLLPRSSIAYTPHSEAVNWSWEAFKDFIGVKGWTIGLTEDFFGVPYNQQIDQLSRSGEATNIGRAVKEANLGGLLGATEQQRRYIPTSVNTLRDRRNPLINNMPSWLPGDEDRYWLDFHRGDPFTKLEHGETRLPGPGYEALYPILKGIDPENYPDIFKFKILSDVALGSDSYYKIKNQIEKREEKHELSEYEQKILEKVREQEKARNKKKEFQEYKTEEELKDASIIHKIITKYSENLFHGMEKILPTEPLTFFRPAGKFIHQRSAIEDYQKTQLEGPDTAIWTKPYEHFIKPSILQFGRLLNSDYIDKTIIEKRQIDDYFDKLKYLKNRELYEQALEDKDYKTAEKYKNKYQKTMQGVVTSDIDTDQEILKSYISLPENEKPYFENFVNTSIENREKILKMVPESVGELYKTIWKRKDVIDKPDLNDVEKYKVIKKDIKQEEENLQKQYPDEYKQYLENKKKNKNLKFKEYIADKQALEYVMAKGGLPDKDFSGWDPRIDMDKIKLRTVQLMNDDIYKYGFWKTDVKELNRYISILNDENIEHIAEKLQKEQIDKIKIESQVEDALYDNGFKIKKIVIGDKKPYKDVDLNIEMNNDE